MHFSTLSSLHLEIFSYSSTLNSSYLTFDSCLTCESASILTFEIEKTFVTKKKCPPEKETSLRKEMSAENIFRKKLSSLRKASQSFSRVIESSPEKFKILSSSAQNSSSFCGKSRNKLLFLREKILFFKTSSFKTPSTKRELSKLTHEESSPILPFPSISSSVSFKSELHHLSSSHLSTKSHCKTKEPA